MNKASRSVASFLGAYAGLLGMVHGYYVWQQGYVQPAGIVINAIGPPCMPETVYHACLPALVLIPNLMLAGSMALLVGAALIWPFTWRSGQKRRGRCS